MNKFLHLFTMCRLPLGEMSAEVMRLRAHVSNIRQTAWHKRRKRAWNKKRKRAWNKKRKRAWNKKRRPAWNKKRKPAGNK